MEHLYGGMFQYLNIWILKMLNQRLFWLFLEFSMFKCWGICMEECFNIWISEFWWCSTSDYLIMSIISKVFNVEVLEHLYGGMFLYLNTEAIWPVIILIFWLFLYFSMFKCWSICMEKCFNIWIVELDVRPVIILIISIVSNV